MNLKFTKMHGCGNDYIYFDCINGPDISNPSELSIKLSDRHYGIGGDGIILICKSLVTLEILGNILYFSKAIHIFFVICSKSCVF